MPTGEYCSHYTWIMELFHRDNGLHVWLDIHYVEGETKNLEVLVWNTDSPTHGRLTDIYTFPSTSSTVVSFSRAPTEGRRDRLTNNTDQMCVLLCSMFGRAGLTALAWQPQLLPAEYTVRAISSHSYCATLTQSLRNIIS